MKNGISGVQSSYVCETSFGKLECLWVRKQSFWEVMLQEKGVCIKDYI